MSIAERLPSRNKSFQSAQILTVTELRQQLFTVSQNNGNASVRITGILVSHDIDGQYIRVTDPLSPKSHPANPYKTSNKNTDLHQETKTKNHPIHRIPSSASKNSESKTIVATPLSKKSSTLQNPYFKTPSSSKRKLGTKNLLNSNSARKIVSIPKNRHTSLLERTKKHTLISQKKPSSAIKGLQTKFTPLKPKSKVLKKSSIPFPNSILVDVSSVSTSCMKIGDLVMIIGEVQILKFSESNDDGESNDHENLTLDEKNWKIIDGNGESCTTRLKQAILSSAQRHNEGSTKLSYRNEFFNNSMLSASPKSFSPNISSTKNDSTNKMNEECQQDSNEKSMASTPSTLKSTLDIHKKGAYLVARILKNVNGTDMQLFHRTLLLRRKYYGDCQ